MGCILADLYKLCTCFFSLFFFFASTVLFLFFFFGRGMGGKKRRVRFLMDRVCVCGLPRAWEALPCCQIDGVTPRRSGNVGLTFVVAVSDVGRWGSVTRWFCFVDLQHYFAVSNSGLLTLDALLNSMNHYRCNRLIWVFITVNSFN